MTTPTATATLRVLIIDDSEHDAALMVLALKRAGIRIAHERVDTLEPLRVALTKGVWDIILCDHAMPNLDSHAVLGLARDPLLASQAPVIIVSGQIGEENLARAFHAGAADYVSKDHLAPLLPAAVSRAMKAEQARKDLEEAVWQLRRQEKLAALGTFVSGVAHEINNPLCYIIGNAELSRQNLDALRERHTLDPDGLQEVAETSVLLETILRGCSRIEHIVHALQRISKSSTGPRSRLPVTEAVETHMLPPPPGVRLVKELRSARNVLVDPRDFQDMFHAILQNSYDAMTGLTGGEVRIETTDAPRGVRISVVDQGTGIPTDQQNNVFTPFFTTKRAGLGLSLSIARRLVDEHGGTLTFESTPGKGTTFHVDLPEAPQSSISELPAA
jgi:two-component system sensor histidine kinase EvgS